MPRGLPRGTHPAVETPRARAPSDFHDLFVFGLAGLNDLLDKFVGDLLHLIFEVFQIVLCQLARLFLRFEFVQRVTADVAHRDFRFLTHVHGFLGELFAPFRAQPGDKSLEAVNYYNGEPVTIPLDPQLTAGENAKKYFEKYNKLKRTNEALSALTKEVHDEIEHLESVANALDIEIGRASCRERVYVLV